MTDGPQRHKAGGLIYFTASVETWIHQMKIKYEEKILHIVMKESKWSDKCKKNKKTQLKIRDKKSHFSQIEAEI